ncbi:MAG: phosphatidylglycerol---prolipoprotein diacylglyceryl transferase [Frankiales bacterium]|nr:phosphatidylglycerol---prolipoprotein diacylglyceryl transferase [Frankiales bacterium]
MEQTEKPPAERDLAITNVPWSALADLEPQALGLTYRFRPPAEGPSERVEVRFVGQRLGVTGPPGPRDAFDVVHVLPRVLAGSGPVALTVRVLDLERGQWHASAQGRVVTTTSRPPVSWHLPRAVANGATGFTPVVQVSAPRVTLGAWPVLVILGLAAGLLAQDVLASHLRLPPAETIAISLGASVVGVLGAKVYFLALHRDQQLRGLPMVGMAVQGFVLSATATAVASAAVLALPLGVYLDVLTAGLLVGLTIGRLGCFFGGCCAGRPTSSRLGRWSSDRTLGVRRVPTQLLESSLSAVLAGLVTAVLWTGIARPHGVAFIGGLAAYTLGRQLLFPLRDQPRTTARGRLVVLVVTLAILCVDLAVALLW